MDIIRAGDVEQANKPNKKESRKEENWISSAKKNKYKIDVDRE